jgi:hypothetical protein
LIAEFTAESDDHGLPCWLLELIGEARSPLALPVLIDQLGGEDEALRDRAFVGFGCWTPSRRGRRFGRPGATV